MKVNIIIIIVIFIVYIQFAKPYADLYLHFLKMLIKTPYSFDLKCDEMIKAMYYGTLMIRSLHSAYELTKATASCVLRIA